MQNEGVWWGMCFRGMIFGGKWWCLVENDDIWCIMVVFGGESVLEE